MHTLHLMTIAADSPQEACINVDNEIVEWGNENNWRTICGCVSEDDQVYIHDKEYGSYHPQPGTTLQSIGKMIKGWTNTFDYNATQQLVKFRIEQETLSAHDWWLLQEYCRFRSDSKYFTDSSFDIWETEYRSWQLAESGLTNMIRSDDGNKKYVVFIDMHS